MIIKSTFSLDAETVRHLERLAAGWGVSKSEALRRLIQTTRLPKAGEPHPAWDMFRQIQARAAKSPKEAEAWARAVRRERKAASRRSESKTQRGRVTDR